MTTKSLYQVSTPQQLSLLENNLAQTPAPAQLPAFCTVPFSKPSTDQYGFLVYGRNWHGFLGYADVEYPTARQIRSQF